MFNPYPKIQLWALNGLPQNKWDALFTLYGNYGPIPHLLFDRLHPPAKYRTGMVEDGTGKVDDRLQHRIEIYDHSLQAKVIEALKLDPVDALSKEEYGVNGKHTIFTVRPYKMKQYEYVSVRPVYGLPAPGISGRIRAATIDISANDVRRLYDFFLRQRASKTSAGWIFEGRMDLVFQRGGRFKATKLGGSTAITIQILPKRCEVFSKASELGNLLRKDPRSPSISPHIFGVYFKPPQCSFCSLNSFTISKFATTG